MRSLGVALIAALLAGCSLIPPPAGIQITIPATGDVHALPVTIVDHAAIVRDAEPADIPNDIPWETAVHAVPGRDDAILLTWMGGDCDDRAIVTIDQNGARYDMTVKAQSSAMGCSAIGVFRAVRLTLTEPVGPDAFASP